MFKFLLIKSFPNSDEFGTVIDAGSEGTYCFNLSGVSNISIENITLINGNTSIIMNKCRNITISGNKLSNYREIGINATSSSSILIKNNLLKSDCSECRGIVLIDSNSNTNHQSIIRNNSFDMPSNCLSLKLKNSCGNKIYLSKSINYFRENNVECGLINSSQAVKYVCKNNREFEFDPSTDITQENFCNDLMLGV